MTDTGYVICTEASQSTYGTRAWATSGYYALENITTYDGDSYALISPSSGELSYASIEAISPWLVGTGAIGTAKTIGEEMGSGQTVSKGGSSDLWGLDADDARILSEDFGFAIRIKVVADNTEYSYWCIAHGFHLDDWMNIADLKGFEVRYLNSRWYSGFSSAGFNWIDIKVTYEPHNFQPPSKTETFYPNSTGGAAWYGDDDQPASGQSLTNSYNSTQLNEISSDDSGYVQASWVSSYPQHIVKFKIDPKYIGLTRIDITAKGIGHSSYTDPDDEEYKYVFYIWNNDTSSWEFVSTDSVLNPDPVPESFTFNFETSVDIDHYMNEDKEIFINVCGTDTGSCEWTRMFYAECEIDGWYFGKNIVNKS